jgi:hypothetical protein
MFLTRPDQEAPGLMLWNQQLRRYLHNILTPSEPEPFYLDKLIPEALPLMEAPPVVCLVHLYKLLCDVTFCSFLIFKGFTCQIVLKAGNSKNSHAAE